MESYILFRKRATSTGAIPVVSNYTYKGKILKKEGSRILVQYYTDEYGNDINLQNLTSYIQSSDLLTQGTSSVVDLQRIYVFNSQLQATGYVIKSRSANPLMKATDTGLGAGVYGVYIPKYSEDWSMNSIKIPLRFSNPLILADGVHGESLTLAARSLNIYLDRVLAISKLYNVSELQMLISETLPVNIYNLWDIFLSRTTGGMFSWNKLIDYCVEYVNNYHLTIDQIDSITSQNLQKPPINHILTSLGYDGIVAADRDNNRRDRGCVLYTTDHVTIHHGSTGKY